MDIKDLIEEAGYTAKRKASCHGGEYSSPCPFCKEGDDRFLSWPNRSNKNGELQGGRFTCRVCGKYGDAITFLRDLYQLSYREACEKLRIPLKERTASTKVTLKQALPTALEPPVNWTEKATLFVTWCHEKLMSNSAFIELILSRGITLEAMIDFKLGFCPENYWRNREDWGLEPELKENEKPRTVWLPKGIVIPTIQHKKVVKVKIRRTEWTEGNKYPKYVELSGSKKSLSIFGDTNTNVAVIVESELDAILIQQFAGDLCFCVALGGSTKALDRYIDELLRSIPRLFFCPDFDKAGATAWTKWQALYPHIKRILTPDGKGPGDAYLSGVDLREWISLELEACLRNEKRFSRG